MDKYRNLALHRLRDHCDTRCTIIFRPIQCVQVLDPIESQEPLHVNFLLIGRNLHSWANSWGLDLCAAYDIWNEYHRRQRHSSARDQFELGLDSLRLDRLPLCGYYVSNLPVTQTDLESRHWHLLDTATLATYLSRCPDILHTVYDQLHVHHHLLQWWCIGNERLHVPFNDYCLHDPAGRLLLDTLRNVRINERLAGTEGYLKRAQIHPLSIHILPSELLDPNFYVHLAIHSDS